MVDISSFLDGLQAHRTLDEKLYAYFELQIQVIYQELHLETLRSFGMNGITPEKIIGLSHYPDFIGFLENNRIKMEDYMSRYEERLHERCKSDTMVARLLHPAE